MSKERSEIPCEDVPSPSTRHSSAPQESQEGDASQLKAPVSVVEHRLDLATASIVEWHKGPSLSTTQLRPCPLMYAESESSMLVF